MTVRLTPFFPFTQRVSPTPMFTGFNEASIVRHFDKRIPGSSEFFVDHLAYKESECEHMNEQIKDVQHGIEDNDSAGYDYQYDDVDNDDYDYHQSTNKTLKATLERVKAQAAPLTAQFKRLQEKLKTAITDGPIAFVREIYVTIGRHSSYQPTPDIVEALEDRLTNLI